MLFSDEIKKIQEQFELVIHYSQEIPKVPGERFVNTDSLFEEWLNAKRDFIEAFGGKFIIELPKKVTYKEKIEMMKRHLTDLVSEKGEKNAVLEIRTHFLYYLKGLEGSSEIKNMICKETSYENIIKILDNYLNQLDNLL